MSKTVTKQHDGRNSNRNSIPASQDVAILTIFFEISIHIHELASLDSAKLQQLWFIETTEFIETIAITP